MKRLLIFLGLIFFLGCSPNKEKGANKVLLVSFDGFRPDYLTKTETPNFDKLAKLGVMGEGLIPIFPTKTFPNYYAIATGLYPENNGFVSNRMFDDQLELTFSMSDRAQVENPDWYGGEPIWNTVEKSGKKAGTMFWVGSEAPIQNMRPSFWKPYNGSMPNKDRIDSVLSWMTLGNKKEADFGTVYFSFIDSEGHKYGTESDEVVKAIQYADRLVGYLIREMKRKNLWDTTNLIIVSDHGMMNVSRDKLVILDDYINPDDVEIIEGSPSVMMNARKGKLDIIYSALKKNEKNFRVYKKEDLPTHLHLKNNTRTPEIIMIADLGYTINTRGFIEKRLNYPSGGDHGYDNKEKEMRALFLARGPKFKKGFIMSPFENIHIYELIAHLMDLKPAKTDGNIDSVSVMLN